MKKQELNYYNEFIKNIDICTQMATILKEYISNFNYGEANQTENYVHKLENDADINLHNILNYLIKDFLPPIDREDVVMLANKIDDLADSIDEIVINLDILNVVYLRHDINNFIDLICENCNNLKEIMQKFKTHKKYEEVKELIIHTNKLEETGDKLYQDAIRTLYQKEKNPVEILKWHTMYNSLENCIDLCESIANAVEEIIMKNA